MITVDIVSHLFFYQTGAGTSCFKHYIALVCLGFGCSWRGLLGVSELSPDASVFCCITSICSVGCSITGISL